MTNDFAIDILKQYREKPTLINEIETQEEAVWLDEALDMAIHALEQTRWIPVSEKLPDKDGDYLVCYEQGYKEDYDLDDIGIVGFEVDCESFGYWYESFDRGTLGSLGTDWEEIPVVAWMPLPTYKGVE